MKKAVIYHQSRTGTTEKMAYSIQEFLKTMAVESKVDSIKKVSVEDTKKADIVCLGCWTHGFFLFAQHPEKIWIEKVQGMPDISNKKIILFTTYKIATGSIFKKMIKYLQGNPQEIITLKSKNGAISDEDKNKIKTFL
ncbi:MAG: flavodoxin family protein [Bacteroidales bacterium]